MSQDPDDEFDCACNKGTYNNGTACVSCGDYCNACTSADDCTECSSDTMIITVSITASCSCEAGTYYNETQNDCIPCQDKCAVCESDSECTTCIDTDHMEIDSENPGNCKCTGATYWDSEHCVSCGLFCSRCDSTECLDCSNADTHLVDGSQDC